MTDQESLFSTEADPWGEYERRKKELPADLSPAEYTEAIRRIAMELGL